MAAQTKVTIQKTYQGRHWVNVYHLDTPLEDSGGALADLVQAEVAVHNTAVLITNARASTVTPNDQQYISTPINLFGTKNSGNTQLLATFIAARIDFAAGLGRPSRKFIRGSLQEEDVTTFTLGGPGAAAYATYGAAVLAVPGICDVDGEPLTAYAVYPEITNRQHRRGSKKKNTQSSAIPV